MKQLSFHAKSKRERLEECRREHGGEHSVQRRRSRRPINICESVHIVLRSEKAHGPRALTRNKKLVLRVLDKYSKRFRVRAYETAICSNHIHCLVKAKTRKELQNFFRVFAGQVAQQILNEFPLTAKEKRGGTPSAEQKASSHPKNRRTFWQLLLYSRVVSWGREFKKIKAYIIKNTMEALGLIAYQGRNQLITRRVVLIRSSS
jgi:REP element-mobilizing transposase RayT